MTDTVTSPSGKVLHHRATKNTTPKESAEAKAVRIQLNQNTRLAENKEYLKNKNVKAFLDTIATTEGGDYDLMYGGVKGKKNDKWRIKDYSTHPGPGFDGKTTAAGRYQINKGNWTQNGTVAMGLTDFSAATQDLIAVEGLRKPHNAIDALVQGDMPTVLDIASRPWASLPQGPNSPNRYSGQPYTEYKKVIELYKGFGGTVSKE